MTWAITLPLLRHEALLLRRVLEYAERALKNSTAVVAGGLTRQAELFAADEINNIRERLEGEILKGTEE